MDHAVEVRWHCTMLQYHSGSTESPPRLLGFVERGADNFSWMQSRSTLVDTITPGKEEQDCGNTYKSSDTACRWSIVYTEPVKCVRKINIYTKVQLESWSTNL